MRGVQPCKPSADDCNIGLMLADQLWLGWGRNRCGPIAGRDWFLAIGVWFINISHCARFCIGPWLLGVARGGPGALVGSRMRSEAVRNICYLLRYTCASVGKLRVLTSFA